MAGRDVSRRRVIQGAAAAALAVPGSVALAAPGVAFLAIGDWGRASEGADTDGARQQVAVAQAMGLRAASMASQFVLTVGDNFYPRGVVSVDDPQWKRSFEDIYVSESLKTPWHPTLGNHDYRVRRQAQIDYSQKPGVRWDMPGPYYQKRIFGPDGAVLLDLFALDTTPIEGAARFEPTTASRSEAPAQLEWLERSLRDSPAPWKIAYGHHAIFSGGSKHGNGRRMIEKVKPLLEKYKVQAYIAGHDHDLQHLVSGPVHYICTGAGSEVRPVRRIGETKFCCSTPGFTAYSISGDVLTVRFFDAGNQLRHVVAIPQTPGTQIDQPVDPELRPCPENSSVA